MKAKTLALFIYKAMTVGVMAGFSSITFILFEQDSTIFYIFAPLTVLTLIYVSNLKEPSQIDTVIFGRLFALLVSIMTVSSLIQITKEDLPAMQSLQQMDYATILGLMLLIRFISIEAWIAISQRTSE